MSIGEGRTGNHPHLLCSFSIRGFGHLDISSFVLFWRKYYELFFEFCGIQFVYSHSNTFHFSPGDCDFYQAVQTWLSCSVFTFHYYLCSQYQLEYEMNAREKRRARTQHHSRGLCPKCNKIPSFQDSKS